MLLVFSLILGMVVVTPHPSDTVDDLTEFSAENERKLRIHQDGILEVEFVMNLKKLIMETVPLEGLRVISFSTNQYPWADQHQSKDTWRQHKLKWEQHPKLFAGAIRIVIRELVNRGFFAWFNETCTHSAGGDATWTSFGGFLFVSDESRLGLGTRDWVSPICH